MVPVEEELEAIAASADSVLTEESDHELRGANHRPVSDVSERERGVGAKELHG